MSAKTVEQRLEVLEAEVTLLRKRVATTGKTGWRAFVGAFQNDPYFERAMEYGRQYRESLRPKAPKRKNSRGRS